MSWPSVAKKPIFRLFQMKRPNGALVHASLKLCRSRMLGNKLWRPGENPVRLFKGRGQHPNERKKDDDGRDQQEQVPKDASEYSLEIGFVVARKWRR